MLDRRALFVPALPLASEVLVELLALVCERDAVAGALLRRAAFEGAASWTRHQRRTQHEPGVFTGSNLRRQVAGP